MLEEQAATVQRRQAPGIFSYMTLFSSRALAYSLYFGVPLVIALLSMILNGWFLGTWDFIYFFEILFVLTMITFIGTFFSIAFYHKKSHLPSLSEIGFIPRFILRLVSSNMTRDMALTLR